MLIYVSSRVCLLRIPWIRQNAILLCLIFYSSFSTTVLQHTVFRFSMFDERVPFSGPMPCNLYKLFYGISCLASTCRPISQSIYSLTDGRCSLQKLFLNVKPTCGKVLPVLFATKYFVSAISQMCLLSVICYSQFSLLLRKKNLHCRQHVYLSFCVILYPNNILYDLFFPRCPI